MRSLFQTIIILFLLLLPFAACAVPAETIGQEGLSVTVSILPEKYLVDRISGRTVPVNVMVGPSDSPHTYEPKPEQMAALSHSELYFRIGVEFEDTWMDRISAANPELRIVDVSEGIQKIPLGEQAHESGVSSEKEVLDPHVWTSPELMKEMAALVEESLSEADPQNAEMYRHNLALLLTDIQNLQNEIETSLSGLQVRKFMVFHPSWGYFAREFGLEQIPIEVGGTEPGAGELASLVTEAKKEDIRVVFAQPEFSTRVADYIAREIGGEVILISPLAENWLENLRQLARVFRSKL